MTNDLTDTAEPAEDPLDCGELVERVLAGETESFRTLVESFEPAIRGLCRRLASPAEADDLVQETFVRAFHYLPRLADRSRFAPWLYQIARSLCLMRRRRAAVEQRALTACAEELRRRASGTDGADGGDLVRSALAELAPEEREALELRYFDGLSYSDMARRLDLSFARVDHLVRKARARLARRLQVLERDGAY
jgi:RNA polymerase sigma-70 factor (ECF subfamily)